MPKLIPDRKIIKQQRRAIARLLTFGIVSNHENLEALERNRISRVLVCRPNHRLGNLLALTPLLAELENVLPWAEIDVVVAGGVAQDLFSGYANVARVFRLPHYAFKSPLQYLRKILAIRKREYDLVINTRTNSSTGRLIANLSNARYRIFTSENSDLRKTKERRHFAKGPVCLLRGHLMGSRQQQQRIPPLDIRLTHSEILWGKETLSRIHRQSGQTQATRTIALFTHATGKKCYDSEWWQAFYKLLSERYGDHGFIEILPAHAKSRLGFAAPVFYSSDIRKLASLISATDVFIGADGGIMHLASAAKVQTIGLFSVTDPESFCPYGGQNTSIHTTAKSHRDIVKLISRKIDVDPLQRTPARGYLRADRLVIDAQASL